MKTKLLVVILMTVSLVFNAMAANTSNNEVMTKPSVKVQKLIDKYNLEVVDYEYVKKAIGNGTRKGAKSLLIDARPNAKYKKGTIPSSLNIPDTKFAQFYKQIETADKNRELIVFCGGWKCGKSPKVAGMLQEKGFKNIKLYQAGEPQWRKKTYSEVDTVVMKSAQKKNTAVLIDARPYKKYLQATIPGSISVPDTQMDKLLGKFPADKNIKVITFCGGYGCGKSHKVAKKLLKMGYKNVSVYAGGVPQWKKEGFSTTGAAAKNAEPKMAKKDMPMQNGIKKGTDEGTVDGEWFKKLVLTNSVPANIQLVDVVPPEDFRSGHLPNAINIYAEEMNAKAFFEKLPTDKMIVFNCASGARALEAWMKLKENNYSVANVYYFDANINCTKNMQCQIEVNEPLD